MGQNIVGIEKKSAGQIYRNTLYYFRVFELNKNAMKPLYSMLHTGNFVYDNEVRNSLISLGMENKEAYSLVYYDNTCDVYDAGAAEEVAEQDSGNM